MRNEINSVQINFVSNRTTTFIFFEKHVVKHIKKFGAFVNV